MKKLTGLLLSGAMLLSLTACGGSKIDDKALDVFEAAIINVTKMESAEFTLGFKQTAKGANSEIAVDGSMINKDGNPKFRVTADVTANEVVQKDFFQFYLTDSIVYVNMMNIAKQKETLDLSMLAALSNTTVKKGALRRSGIKEYLKEASIDGEKVKIVFDSEKLKKEISKESKDDVTGALDSVKDFQFETFEIEMVVKKKVMQSAKATIDMKTMVEDKAVNAKVVVNTKFKNINKVESIQFPDFSEYVASESATPLLGL